MGKVIKLTESQIKSLIESSIINENIQNKVDNFDKVSAMLNITDNDKFYFVQVIKRFKDNRDMQRDLGNTYHAGGDYGNYASQTAFKVRTAQDLMSIKQRLIDYCDKNNARAYITSNPRSESQIANYKQRWLDIQKHRNHGTLPKYADYADEIIAAQAKEDASWTDRPRFFLDVDSSDKRIWEVTKSILNSYNVPIETEYTTPSGGLHIVIADRFAINNINKLIDLLRVFDNFKDLGRTQTVHANFDGKILLYANVDTKGY